MRQRHSAPASQPPAPPLTPPPSPSGFPSRRRRRVRRRDRRNGELTARGGHHRTLTPWRGPLVPVPRGGQAPPSRRQRKDEAPDRCPALPRRRPAAPGDTAAAAATGEDKSVAADADNGGVWTMAASGRRQRLDDGGVWTAAAAFGRGKDDDTAWAADSTDTAAYAVFLATVLAVFLAVGNVSVNKAGWAGLRQARVGWQRVEQRCRQVGPELGPLASDAARSGRSA